MKTQWILLSILAAALLSCFLTGCEESGQTGYTNSWLYPDDVSTVYVEMFDTSSFRRGFEYTLTDAICKRIEAETPYKIVSDRDYADTILTGRMGGVRQTVLTRDRYTGTTLEREAGVKVIVNWKNLKTGEMLVNNESVTASASYSDKVDPQQTFDYAANLAVNRAAEKVVELMQTDW